MRGGSMDKERRGFKLALVIGFILIFIYLIVGLNIFSKDNLLGFFTTKEESTGFGIWFTILGTILMVFFVPITWFSALGAFLFGFRGFIYAIIGGTISSVISFYIAQIFRQDVMKIVDKIYYRKERDISLEQVSTQIEEYGMDYVFFIRSMPFIPFSIVNYVSGLSSISLRDYIWGTILGLAPGQLINNYFFVKAIDVEKNPLGTLIAAAIKGGYILIIMLWKRKSKYTTKE